MKTGFSKRPFLISGFWKKGPALAVGRAYRGITEPPKPDGIAGNFHTNRWHLSGAFRFCLLSHLSHLGSSQISRPPQVSCRMTGWGGKSWAAPGRTTAQCPPHMPPLRPLPAVIPGGAPEAPQCPPRNPGAMGFSDFYERPCSTPMIGNTLE